jgi:putative transposase
MLDNHEFIQWCQRVDVSKEAKQILEQVRSSDPCRRVQSGARNVSGTYPSKKMEFTIQFESHKGELARVYEMEHDQDVLTQKHRAVCCLSPRHERNRRNHGILDNAFMR